MNNIKKSITINKCDVATVTLIDEKSKLRVSFKVYLDFENLENEIAKFEKNLETKIANFKYLDSLEVGVIKTEELSWASELEVKT